jgi:DNA polymerase
MELTIDFETRSACDLKKHGLFRYVEDPTTDAMKLGVMVGDEEPRIWLPDYFRNLLLPKFGKYLIRIEIRTPELLHLVDAADKIIAQNSMFEFCMWNVVCHRKYGFPKIPLEKFHDTMAQLAYHALPQNLEKAAKALRLQVQKDMNGHKAMMKLCKPKSRDPIVWNEDPDLIWSELLYCLDDCRAERLIYKTLPKLPEKEREIWLWNERVNLRGIPVDLTSARTWADAIEEDKADLLKEFKTLCRNEVSSPRSYVKLKEWVNRECGLDLESLGKEQTAELLENEGLPKHVRRILEIKTEAGKASAAKLKAMIDRANGDSRVRGCSAYHGASPGRFAARGIQPHNMPRDSLKPKDYELALAVYRAAGKEGLQAMYDLPSFVASRSVRGTIMAPDGYIFVCSDYSSIESMGLNHQAGEEWVLDAFRRGECVYKHNAARILGKPYTSIDDDERQKPGKISELASGYQGSAGAVRKFDAMPGVSDAEIIKTITQPWRDAHPMVVAFWKGVESAAKDAIKNPGKVFSYRDIQFASDRVFLRMRLPSGRCLHYFQPGIEEKRFIKKNDRPGDHPEDCTCNECGWYAENMYYWGMKQVDGKTTTQFAKVYSYGGKLAENAIQGLCRDIMCDGALRVENHGFPVVFTVHDEVISLIKESDARTDTLQVFEQVLSEVPSYVAGLPLIAKKGWIGKRYRK